MKKLSKNKLKLQELTGLSLGEFFDTKCIGMSRQEIQTLIEEVTNGKLKMTDSAIWYWVQDGIKDGYIKEFCFAPKKGRRKKTVDVIKVIEEVKESAKEAKEAKENEPVQEEPTDSTPEISQTPPENPTQDNHEPENPAREETPVQEKETRKPKSIELSVSYTCNECHGESTSVVTCDIPEIIGLRAYKCPECGEFGSCHATFQHEGISAKKALVDIGYQKEEFVNFLDSEMKVVDNPFKELAHTNT